MGKDWRSGARDMLVVVLTVTTGGVDAAAFLHLGHVFSSVITGTMVLLGVAAGTHDAVLAEKEKKPAAWGRRLWWKVSGGCAGVVCLAGRGIQPEGVSFRSPLIMQSAPKRPLPTTVAS